MLFILFFSKRDRQWKIVNIVKCFFAVPFGDGGSIVAIIFSTWLIVEVPGKRGLPRIISARIQPMLHISIPFVYLWCTNEWMTTICPWTVTVSKVHSDLKLNQIKLCHRSIDVRLHHRVFLSSKRNVKSLPIPCSTVAIATKCHFKKSENVSYVF